MMTYQYSFVYKHAARKKYLVWAKRDSLPNPMESLLHVYQEIHPCNNVSNVAILCFDKITPAIKEKVICGCVFAYMSFF